MDFTASLMICSSLLALYISFLPSQDKKYMSEMSKLMRNKNVLLQIILIRILIASVLSILFYFTLIISLRIRDVPINITFIRCMAATIPAIAIFTIIGTTIGYLEHKFLQYLLLAYFTIALLLMLPWAIEMGRVRYRPVKLPDKFVMQLERKNFHCIGLTIQRKKNTMVFNHSTRSLK
jgi:hypothetical protein